MVRRALRGIMREVRFQLTSIDEFMRLAERVGARLRAGDVVALRGPLGAGKTTFVRGIVRGATGADPVSSPTFTFWHRYPGPVPIQHLDLYRVDEPAELRELGLEEAFTPDAIVLIEWPEHGAGLLPSASLEITIAGAGPQARRVELHPGGPTAARALEGL